MDETVDQPYKLVVEYISHIFLYLKLVLSRFFLRFLGLINVLDFPLRCQGKMFALVDERGCQMAIAEYRMLHNRKGSSLNESPPNPLLNEI